MILRDFGQIHWHVRGNVAVLAKLISDNVVDDQFKWGMIIDVLTNRSFSELPGEPFFKYYNPKKYSRRKPTSEESYQFTACKEFLQESSDYEWREKVEQRGRAAPGGDFYCVFELISMS